MRSAVGIPYLRINSIFRFLSADISEGGGRSERERTCRTAEKRTTAGSKSGSFGAEDFQQVP